MLSTLRYRLRGAKGTEVVVEGDRLVDPDGSADFTIDLGPGELRGGLINAHDHLHRNHYPRLGAPPYADSYAWGRDIHARDSASIARARSVDRRDALLFGALKNLLGGVTTVVHHDAWEPAFDSGFPLRVARVRTVHSLGTEPERAANPPGDPHDPICIHLAEGTTPAIAAEVREADRLGLLNDRLVAVHAIGVDLDGADLMARLGVAVAWCPTSNAYLFGRTAPRELLARVDVMIGSDSLLTGAGTILDELRYARATGPLDDRRLLDGVGGLAASRFRLPFPVLDPGAPADLALFARSPLEATSEDVGLVVVAGRPRLADERFAALFEFLALPFERIQVGCTTKLVSAPLGSVAERILADWPEARRVFQTAPDGA